MLARLPLECGELNASFPDNITSSFFDLQSRVSRLSLARFSSRASKASILTVTSGCQRRRRVLRAAAARLQSTAVEGKSFSTRAERETMGLLVSRAEDEPPAARKGPRGRAAGRRGGARTLSGAARTATAARRGGGGGGASPLGGGAPPPTAARRSARRTWSAARWPTPFRRAGTASAAASSRKEARRPSWWTSGLWSSTSSGATQVGWAGRVGDGGSKCLETLSSPLHALNAVSLRPSSCPCFCRLHLHAWVQEPPAVSVLSQPRCPLRARVRDPGR